MLDQKITKIDSTDSRLSLNSAMVRRDDYNLCDAGSCINLNDHLSIAKKR